MFVFHQSGSCDERTMRLTALNKTLDRVNSHMDTIQHYLTLEHALLSDQSAVRVIPPFFSWLLYTLYVMHYTYMLCYVVYLFHLHVMYVILLGIWLLSNFGHILLHYLMSISDSYIISYIHLLQSCFIWFSNFMVSLYVDMLILCCSCSCMPFSFPIEVGRSNFVAATAIVALGRVVPAFNVDDHTVLVAVTMFFKEKSGFCISSSCGWQCYTTIYYTNDISW